MEKKLQELKKIIQKVNPELKYSENTYCPNDKCNQPIFIAHYWNYCPLCNAELKKKDVLKPIRLADVLLSLARLGCLTQGADKLINVVEKDNKFIEML